MEGAIEEARLALARGEVPVGCVFVDRRSGDIVCRSGNRVNETKNATRHAEMVGIDEMVAQFKEPRDIRDFFSNLVCYVTVEPCIMCLSALRELGVTESVFGCRNDRFGGNTLLWTREFQRNDKPGLVVRPSSDPRDAEVAMELLKTFYSGENPAAPVPKKRKNKPTL